MPETTEELEKQQRRELEGKNIAYYSVLLQAWIGTRMERDKTLVTLSAAGIGLLVTILTAVGVKHSWQLVLFAGAFFGFLVAIWSSLVIYQLNSEHIEQAIHGSSERDPRLKKYDRTSLWAFLTGATLTIFVGLSSAINYLTAQGDSQMAKEQKGQGQNPQRVPLRESLDEIGKMAPQGTMKKSLDGITGLKPESTQPPAPPRAPASQGPTTGTTSPANQQQNQDKK